MVLVDPVIFDPAAYAAWLPSAPEEHPVSRRRNNFASPEALYENLHGRGGYASWDEAVLRDYCVHGLVRYGDEFTLACPPIIEATVYTGSGGTDITPRLEAIHMPVTVMRARPRGPDTAPTDFSSSPTRADLATCFRNGEDRYLPELTHFIPMQAPSLVAAEILKYADLTK